MFQAEAGSDRRHFCQQGIVDFAHVVVHCRDPITNFAHLLDLRLPFGGVFHLANLLRDSVALGFERFHLAQQRAALQVECQHLVDYARVVLPVAQGFADSIGFFADQVQI